MTLGTPGAPTPAKPIWQSKTFWFGVAQWVVAASTLVSPIIPPALLPWFGASGIITIVLRMVTSQPVTLK